MTPNFKKCFFSGDILLLLLLLSGCASVNSPGKNALLSVSTPEVAYGEREYTQSLSTEKKAALDALFNDLFKLSKATGLSACVYFPGEGLWKGALGVEDNIAHIPITPSSRFHAGSIGKMVTAVLVMKLVERNVFSLDTRINRWFPDSSHAQTISVDNLLNHTSGLRANLEPTGKTQMAMLDAVNAALAQALIFEPGTGFSYSNVGYMILGVILEKEYGFPLTEVIENEFIRPLNLQNTRAINFQNKDDVLIGSTHDGAPGRDAIDYSSVGGAGIVATTPCDLVKFINALLAHEVIDSVTLNNMGERIYPMNLRGTLHWSRGLMVVDSPLGKIFYLAGRIKGFGAVAGYHPRIDAFVAVMINDDNQIDSVMFRLFSFAREQQGL